MKVALTIEQLDPSRGGAESSCAEMARLLVQSGLSVSVLTERARGIDETAFDVVDFNIRAAGSLPAAGVFARRAKAFLNNNAFDVVHAIMPVSDATVYQPRGGLIDETFRRNLARRSPVAAFVRRCVGPNPKQRHLRCLERHLARRTNCCFLAVSDYVARQFTEHLRLPDERMRVIYNGVDLERLRRPVEAEVVAHLKRVLKIKPDELVALFVANNLKLKGMGAILAAFASLRATDASFCDRLRLVVISSDNYWPYHKRIERAGLDGQIVFLGPATNMARLYALADFVIHPTWYDPCSRVVLEAMACGVPSITTEFNGAAEIIRRADCGMVIDDADRVDQLADATKVMLDRSRRQQYSENCGKMDEAISMRRHVRELIALYEELQTR